MFTLILQIALGIMAVSTFLYVIRVIKGRLCLTGSWLWMQSASI